MFHYETIFVGLSQNIALLFALTFAYGVLLEYFDKQPHKINPFAFGFLFGGVALIGMSLPIGIGDEVFVDGRFVVLVLGATLAGARPALVASGMTAIYQLLIGGAGAVFGVGAIFSVMLIGLAMHRYQRQSDFKLGALSLLVTGVSIAAVHLLWLLPIPDDVMEVRPGRLVVALFVLYPIGTFLLGKLLAHENQRVALKRQVQTRAVRLEAEVDQQARALKESEVQFRTLTETTSAGIWIVQDGLVQYANPAAAMITGYQRDELIRHPFMKIIDQEHQAQVEEDILQSTDHKRPQEVKLKTYSGDLRQAILNSGNIEYEGERAIILTAFDVTALKAAERAEREQRMLAEALRSSAIAVTQTLELSEVFDRIMAYVGQVVPYEFGSITLIEDAVVRIVRVRDRLSSLTMDEWVHQTYIIADTPNLATMLASGEPLIIDDVQADPGWTAAPRTERWRSYIGVPVHLKHQAIGFLHLISSQPSFFTQTHADRLQAFAAQAATAIQNAQLHEQAQQLAAEAERQRLARDLHDSVTQTLFSANIIAQTLLKTYEQQPERVPELLNEIYQLNQNAYTEMRVLLTELRPDQLVRHSLYENLQQLVKVMQSRFETDIQLNVPEVLPLPTLVQITFYRIAQEALTNALKHAEADHIEIKVEQNPDSVKMIIQDGGKGFDLNTVIHGIGMDSMRERAIEIGAKLYIESDLQKGTLISVIWHFPQPDT